MLSAGLDEAIKFTDLVLQYFPLAMTCSIPVLETCWDSSGLFCHHQSALSDLAHWNQLRSSVPCRESIEDGILLHHSLELLQASHCTSLVFFASSTRKMTAGNSFICVGLGRFAWLLNSHYSFSLSLALSFTASFSSTTLSYSSVCNSSQCSPLSLSSLISFFWNKHGRNSTEGRTRRHPLYCIIFLVIKVNLDYSTF